MGTRNQAAKHCLKLHLRLRKNNPYTFSPIAATTTWYHSPDSDVPRVVEVCLLAHDWTEATPALNPGLPTPNPLGWLWVVNSSFLHYFWGLKDYCNAFSELGLFTPFKKCWNNFFPHPMSPS